MNFSENICKCLVLKSISHIQELITSDADPQMLRGLLSSLERELGTINNVEDYRGFPLINQIHVLCVALEQTFNFIRNKEENREDIPIERDISIESLDDLSLANISQFGNSTECDNMKAEEITFQKSQRCGVDMNHREEIHGNIHNSSDALSSDSASEAESEDQADKEEDNDVLTESSDDNSVDEEQLSSISKRKKSLKKFQCSICNRFLVSKQSLEYHMITHLPENDPRKKKNFGCEICDKLFSSKKQLKDHERAHLAKNDPRKKKIECEKCNKFFWDKGDLRKHERIHFDELEKRRPYKCDDCGKRFTQQGALNVHKRTHLLPDDPRRKKFKCDVDGCGKRYVKSLSLLEHMKSHLPPDHPRRTAKEFICDICGKSFSSRSGVYIHKKIHNEELPYKCDECGKRFTQSTNLSRHINCIHLAVGDPNKKQFECSVCGKTFSAQPSLYIHKRVHEEEEEKRLPFKCDICGKRFLQQGNFKRHKDTHLPENDPQRYKFTCEVCHKSFTEKGTLRSHQRSHLESKEARMPYKCEDCGKRFSLSCNFKKHRDFVHLGRKQVPSKCEICGKSFASKKNASKHMKNIHGVTKCDIQKQKTRKNDDNKNTNHDVNEKGAWSDEEISEEESKVDSDADDGLEKQSLSK